MYSKSEVILHFYILQSDTSIVHVVRTRNCTRVKRLNTNKYVEKCKIFYRCNYECVEKCKKEDSNGVLFYEEQYPLSSDGVKKLITAAVIQLPFLLTFYSLLSTAG